MKVAEFRKLTNEELVAKVKQYKEELFNLRFQLATGQLTTPKRITECKRDIARALTILTEREQAAKKANA